MPSSPDECTAGPLEHRERPVAALAPLLLGETNERLADCFALHGAPASLFNQPRPGEALEARLPTPAPGQMIELVLKIWDDRGASSELPVRIRRAR